MKKLTVEVCDYDCYDFPRICAELAKTYFWEEYAVREGKDDDGFQFAEVDFRMDGTRYRGEVFGNEFAYYETDENDGTLFPDTMEILDWMEACDVRTAIRATDEEGRICFIAESNG